MAFCPVKPSATSSFPPWKWMLFGTFRIPGPRKSAVITVINPHMHLLTAGSLSVCISLSLFSHCIKTRLFASGSRLYRPFADWTVCCAAVTWQIAVCRLAGTVDRVELFFLPPARQQQRKLKMHTPKPIIPTGPTPVNNWASFYPPVQDFFPSSLGQNGQVSKERVGVLFSPGNCAQQVTSIVRQNPMCGLPAPPRASNPIRIHSCALGNSTTHARRSCTGGHSPIWTLHMTHVLLNSFSVFLLTEQFVWFVYVVLLFSLVDKLETSTGRLLEQPSWHTSSSHVLPGRPAPDCKDSGSRLPRRRILQIASRKVARSRKVRLAWLRSRSPRGV